MFLEVNGVQLFYEVNEREVAFFPYDDTGRYFGTDEVNGYLFYILYEDNAFMLSLFHGLTDARGMIAYVVTTLWYYLISAVPLSETPIVNVSRYRVRGVPGAGALLKPEDRGEEQLSLIE